MAEASWQQEKEFLDYMFVSLNQSGGASSADESLGNNNNEMRITSSSSSRPRTARISSSGSSGSNNNNQQQQQQAAADGLDHLDNLCKLMEQLGELKDANSRLQKRVQYLEDMKTLQEMHQELDMQLLDPTVLNCAPSDKEADRSIDSLDSGDNILSSSVINISEDKTRSGKRHHHHHRLKKPSSIQYRERSKSVGYDDPPLSSSPPDTESCSAANNTMDSSDYISTDGGGNSPPEVFIQIPAPKAEASIKIHHQQVRIKTKVSKWTRVKEAFRWEKAHVESIQHHQPKSKMATPLVAAILPAPIALNPVVSIVKAPIPESPIVEDVNISRNLINKDPESPVFLLSRRRNSASSGSSTTSSSALSECPLESEILKSFADAQELPLFRMDNKKESSPDMLKRLSRQSTVSCDANFAAPMMLADIPARIPEGELPPPETPSPSIRSGSKSKTPESPSRRKTSCKPPAGMMMMEEHQQLEASGVAATDEMSGSFMANLRSQLKPINEWTAKWHCDLMKINNNTPSSPGVGPPSSANSGSLLDPPGTRSRSSLSVPSSPNQLSAFTFDEYPEAGLEHGTASRDNSPVRMKKDPAAPTAVATITNTEPVTATVLSSPTQVPSPTWMVSSSRPAYNPGSLLSSISPEFRKKVEVWERLKSGLTVEAASAVPPSSSTTASSVTSTPSTPAPTAHHPHKKSSAAAEMSPDWGEIGLKRRSESDKLPPAFKKKLAEWEIRKAVAGKSDREVEELQKILPQDFNRKLQEWERMKAAAAAGGTKMAAPVSPGLERQGSGKRSVSGISSGGANTASAGGKVGGNTSNSKTSGGEEQTKSKEKDLQWLEKELQKIEREKLRLEREREKYMERESRLEKIREAMKHQPTNSGGRGAGGSRQRDEICIRTSTGEFRFQGLSRKFTKKLFQWEEQKGIRPEASTIALLDGAYRPPGGYEQHHPHCNPSVIAEGILSDNNTSVGGSNGGTASGIVRPTSLALIGRSKSESSVVDLVSASVHSQPSSLSLSNTECTADYDRRLAGMDQDDGGAAYPSPGALIVEVEDVMEESAAVVDIPEVRPQEPVYSIAPAEHRQIIRVSDELDHPPPIERNDSVRTEASFKLLEENLSLLDRLRAKGEIVKYLEIQMNSIDGDMAGVASTQTEEMVRLKEEEETYLSDPEDASGGMINTSTIERLKNRIIHLESRGQQLKAEKEQLQAVYNKQCSQQVQMVRHLVEKMQQLRGIGSSIEPLPSGNPEALQRLDSLTSELLRETRELEASIQHPEFRCSDSSTDVQQLSIKANQLKEEFERLRSIDSSEEEATISAQIPAALPPIPAEMSTAARKKIFVETRRLVFAPLEGSPSAASGRNTSNSWRKNSLTEEATEFRSIRNTAPNIRRMIDKYSQRVQTGSSSSNRPAITPLNLRMRFGVNDYYCADRSTSSTPPLTPQMEATSGCPTPPTTDESSTSELLPVMNTTPLCKSQSTGAMGSDSASNKKPEVASGSVLRSRSGVTINTEESTKSSAAPCARNPSFFRKSPLDPSIDELLQKYRGRTHHHHHASQPVPDLPKSPTSSFHPERAVRLKQAREAFLAIGPGAIDPVQIPETRICPPTPTPPSTPLPEIVLHPCSEGSPSPPPPSDPVPVPAPIPVNFDRVVSSSCPSSPGGFRRPNASTNSSANSAGRRSWLKQPTKFFFFSSMKPKTP